MQGPVQTIPQAFLQLKRQGFIRQLDAAQRLHLSEGELIAAHVNQDTFWRTVTQRDVGSINLNSVQPKIDFYENFAEEDLSALRLRPDWHALMASLEPIGEVMALTRNASCVHEKIGVYQNATLTERVGVMASDNIDLRAFYSKWAHGFAVSEMTIRGQQRSLQFFDASGVAIHKIHLGEHSDAQAYQSLIKYFADDSQQPGLYTENLAIKPPEQADYKIDVQALHQDWDTLRDTHDFFALLKTHGVSRVQALRLAQPKFVQQVHCADVLRVLTAAAAREIPIMVFVGNHGMLQIHSGPIQKVWYARPWLNVLDASFNLHLRMDHIDNAWIVKKPTADGLVTSFEVFDAQGDAITMLFGLRKPGLQELPAWRGLLGEIQETQQACAA
ncbi:MAG: hemin-degrading factor [Alcaligenaceae bacterium]|nr:MAG: hemin-degrading factor [Alcaligenaceae bacterium]